MNIVAHWFASWSVADQVPGLSAKERSALVLVGMAPDLDGPGWYATYHHLLLHGAFGALLLAGLGAWAVAGTRRLFGWALLIAHLPFLCDWLGSRGPRPDDLWAISYGQPFSDAWRLTWADQWPLGGWQNARVGLGLLSWVTWRALTTGRSPAELFGQRANAAFVATLRAWRKRIRGNSAAP